jgi:hypothetical protein
MTKVTGADPGAHRNEWHYFRLGVVAGITARLYSAGRKWHKIPSAFVNGVSMLERRTEERLAADIPVRILGLDSNGVRFEQDAVAENISARGALLSGINQALRPRDLLIIRYREKQACFRVVWTRHSGGERKTQAAVQRREADECPWPELISSRAAVSEGI